jgi:hypothetical protein
MLYEIVSLFIGNDGPSVAHKHPSTMNTAVGPVYLQLSLSTRFALHTTLCLCAAVKASVLIISNRVITKMVHVFYFLT